MLNDLRVVILSSRSPDSYRGACGQGQVPGISMIQELSIEKS